MPIFKLRDDSYAFPDPELAEDNGLLAIGGDLSPVRLLNAYINGIFPWYNEGEPIMWWCPHERFVIIPSEIHISKSMKKFIKSTSLRITFDTAFAEVIHSCRSMRENKEGTWITDDMEEAYNELFMLGFASSCEVWQDSELVGGLYGVKIGRCFFGESMFSKVENASKLALISLARELDKNNFEFIDCQLHTDHLESMGGRYISYNEYITMIEQGVDFLGSKS